MAIYQQQSRLRPSKFLAYNRFTEREECAMRTFVWATVLVISVLERREVLAQSNPPRVIAEFAGAPIKWIHVAEPELRRRHLNLDHYMVSVIEEGDSVTVSLQATDAVEGTRGSSGSYPAFAVEISKTGLKVVRSYYQR
jgi:hypothetical protein